MDLDEHILDFLQKLVEHLTSRMNSLSLDSWKQEALSLQFNSEKEKIEIFKTEYETLLDLRENKDLFFESQLEISELRERIKDHTKKISMSQKKSNEFFLEVQCGVGGEDAQDWTEILFSIYCKYLTRNNIKWNLVDYQKLDAGIRCASIKVKGSMDSLSNEVGIHRLVRISPFNAKGKRQTSFASVYVYPALESQALKIDVKDLRIDTFRSSGAGGQHVNTTDSAVRITHLPSGIVVSCQNERSQHQNKEMALSALSGKLMILQQEEINKQQSLVEKKPISWSSQFRSYVLDPYKMIKDSRLNLEINSNVAVDQFLNGEIDLFIDLGFWVSMKSKIDSLYSFEIF